MAATPAVHGPRCQYLLRTVPPSVTDTLAIEDASAVARCLAVLASAAERRHAAYRASWADTAVALREHSRFGFSVSEPELLRPELLQVLQQLPANRVVVLGCLSGRPSSFSTASKSS